MTSDPQGESRPQGGIPPPIEEEAYDQTVSATTLHVLTLLAEKNNEVELVLVVVFEQEQKNPAHLAGHLLVHLPVLEDWCCPGAALPARFSQALHSPETKGRAQTAAAKLRNEDGVSKAVALIAKKFQA